MDGNSIYIKEYFERGEYDKIVEVMEFVMESDEQILEQASKEEIFAYNVLDSIGEADISQLVENVIKMGANEYTYEQKKNMRKLGRDALKAELIRRWVSRMDSEELEDENNLQ